MINVTIWNEYIWEQQDELVKKIYPNGIHNCIKEFLEKDKELNITTATMKEKDHGLTEAKLKDTNVLIWWGHVAHNEVQDKIVDRIRSRVLEGMGLLVLHSGHESKIFTRLVGTNGNIASYRHSGEKERIWVCTPAHPIANGLDMYFEIEKEEMYSEPFQIPLPDETVFISWFEGGEVFRSGLFEFKTKENTLDSKVMTPLGTPLFINPSSSIFSFDNRFNDENLNAIFI